MSNKKMQIAQLDSSALAKIQALEQDLGAPVVALEPQFPYASLTPEQAEKIQAVEKELGVVILAYRPTTD